MSSKMLPKRESSDEHPAVGSPEQKRRRSPRAILPKNVPLPESPPNSATLASNAPKKVRLVLTNDEILALSAQAWRAFRYE